MKGVKGKVNPPIKPITESECREHFLKLKNDKRTSYDVAVAMIYMESRGDMYDINYRWFENHFNYMRSFLTPLDMKVLFQALYDYGKKLEHVYNKPNRYDYYDPKENYHVRGGYGVRVIAEFQTKDAINNPASFKWEGIPWGTGDLEYQSANERAFFVQSACKLLLEESRNQYWESRTLWIVLRRMNLQLDFLKEWTNLSKLQNNMDVFYMSRVIGDIERTEGDRVQIINEFLKATYNLETINGENFAIVAKFVRQCISILRHDADAKKVIQQVISENPDIFIDCFKYKLRAFVKQVELLNVKEKYIEALKRAKPTEKDKQKNYEVELNKIIKERDKVQKEVSKLKKEIDKYLACAEAIKTKGGNMLPLVLKHVAASLSDVENNLCLRVLNTLEKGLFGGGARDKFCTALHMLSKLPTLEETKEDKKLTSLEFALNKALAQKIKDAPNVDSKLDKMLAKIIDQMKQQSSAPAYESKGEMERKGNANNQLDSRKSRRFLLTTAKSMRGERTVLKLQQQLGFASLRWTGGIASAWFARAIYAGATRSAFGYIIPTQAVPFVTTALAYAALRLTLLESPKRDLTNVKAIYNSHGIIGVAKGIMDYPSKIITKPLQWYTDTSSISLNTADAKQQLGSCTKRWVGGIASVWLARAVHMGTIGTIIKGYTIPTPVATVALSYTALRLTLWHMGMDGAAFKQMYSRFGFTGVIKGMMNLSLRPVAISNEDEFGMVKRWGQLGSDSSRWFGCIGALGLASAIQTGTLRTVIGYTIPTAVIPYAPGILICSALHWTLFKHPRADITHFKDVYQYRGISGVIKAMLHFPDNADTIDYDRSVTAKQNQQLKLCSLRLALGSIVCVGLAGAVYNDILGRAVMGYAIPSLAVPYVASTLICTVLQLSVLKDPQKDIAAMKEVYQCRGISGVVKEMMRCTLRSSGEKEKAL